MSTMNKMSTMNNDGPQPPRKERRRSTVQEVLSKRRDEQYAHVEGPLKSGRLSMCTYLSYAAPSLSTTPCSVLISVYLVPFYETVGARLAYIAFFIALARSFDVLTDPLMSYFTDAFRSKFGRRRPFMLTGAMLISLLCKVDMNEITKMSTFRSGMSACFCVVGISWLGDTIIKVRFNFTCCYLPK